MPKITIEIGSDYNEQLRARLAKLNIGTSELAREMGVDPAQVSRWLHKEMTPRMGNIARIEKAILTIRRRRRGRTSVEGAA